MEIICITGMHRSGTSVVARVANLLGLDLGDEGDHIPMAPDNPRGYWENASISALNQWVLERMGGSWDEPPRLAKGWEHSPQLDEIRVHAVEAINKALGGGTLVGFKDPRASLTLPFWRTIVPVRATVMALRHPGEVAASLRTRNGFDVERAADLWLRYVLSAFVEDPDRLVVPYADLLADIAGNATRIATHLGLEPPGPDLLSQIGEFVEPNLRHHAGEEVRGGPRLELATAVFQLIAHHDPSIEPVIRALYEGPQASAHLAGQKDEIERLAQLLSETVQEHSAMVDELRTSLLERVQHAENELKESRNVIRALEHRAEAAEVAAERLQVELRSTHEAAKVGFERAENAEADLARLAGELDATHRTGLQAVARAEAAEREAAGTAAEVRDLSVQLEAVSSAHEELQRRKSVRAALRVARLARPFLRRRDR